MIDHVFESMWSSYSNNIMYYSLIAIPSRAIDCSGWLPSLARSIEPVLIPLAGGSMKLVGLVLQTERVCYRCTKGPDMLKSNGVGTSLEGHRGAD